MTADEEKVLEPYVRRLIGEESWEKATPFRKHNTAARMWTAIKLLQSVGLCVSDSARVLGEVK